MKLIDALSGWDPDTIYKHIGWAAIHLVIWYGKYIAGCSGKEHAAKMIGYFGKMGEFIEKDYYAKDADYNWTFKEGCKYLEVDDYPGFSKACINGLFTLKRIKAVEF